MGGVMSDLMATAIEVKVNQLFKLRKEHILEKLFDGCDNTDSYEQVYAKGIYNAMIISVDLSVELVIDTLMSLGIVGAADEKKIRKEILSAVQTEQRISN